MLSKLSIYSLGTVTKDKEPDSDILTVVPYEVLTDLDGSLVNYSEEITATLQDSSGNTFSGTTKKAEIECDWLPFGDLRTSSPDMILGEQVIIWRYSNTQDYYWTPKRQDLLNRKLEHIVLTLSNTDQDQEESEPYKKSYTITLSTRDKYLSIVTDDNNKEKAKYTYRIDTGEGVVSLEDNHDNFWKLYSVDRKLEVKTGEVVYDCNTFKITGTLDVLKLTTLHDNLISKMNFNLSGNETIGGTSKVGGSLSAGGSGSFGGGVTAAGFSSGGRSVKYV